MPRDEVVVTFDGVTPAKSSGSTDVNVLDLTQLAPTDAGTAEIDTGVTSGADPSGWDTVTADSDNEPDHCAGNSGSQSSSTQGSPPACGVRQQP